MVNMHIYIYIYILYILYIIYFFQLFGIHVELLHFQYCANSWSGYKVFQDCGFFINLFKTFQFSFGQLKLLSFINVMKKNAKASF